MLQVARLAPNLLCEAREPIVDFFERRINPDGGGQDRSGKSDLYYTVFAVEGLIALQAEPPIELVRSHLEGFADGEGLDFVHLTCLARCWAALPNGSLDASRGERIGDRIESFRSADGGYDPKPGAATGTVYHCFLALGAYQDLGAELPHPERLGRCVETLRTDDGAYANVPGVKIGTTTATAAAATLLRQLDMPVRSSVGEWLMARGHAEGGFLATSRAPMPDLLSTATALHALAGLHVSFDDRREQCLDFIDSLWTGRAFCGHWADDAEDSEYTYYALLALGHLSL